MPANGSLAMIVSGVLAAACVATAAQDGAADPDAARTAINKWVETQQIIVKERRDWEQARQMLEGRIELLEREVADLDMKIGEARRTAAEAAGRTSGLIAEIDSLEGLAASAGSALAGLEEGIRGLRPALPSPLQEKLSPLYGRMPEPSGATGVSLAERFQNVLGILNEITKSNSEISLATEIRALSDGRPSEVTTVYLGLGQAYYLSRGGEAGVGRPGPQGWVWQTDGTLTPHITQVIEILQNKSSPGFVALPVHLQ